MKNEELKKKIVDILVNCKSDECAIEYCSECDGNPCIENCREKQQADALIAAGIGDVSEYKHRAQVAEKAFSNCIENFVKFQYEQKSIQLDNVFLDEVIKKCLQQAEKELAEERKDD